MLPTVLLRSISDMVKQVDLNDTVKYTNILNNAIAIEFPNVKIQNDMDRVIVIQEVDPARKQEEYRHELKEIVMKIQKRDGKYEKRFKSPCRSRTNDRGD